MLTKIRNFYSKKIEPRLDKIILIISFITLVITGSLLIVGKYTNFANTIFTISLAIFVSILSDITSKHSILSKIREELANLYGFKDILKDFIEHLVKENPHEEFREFFINVKEFEAGNNYIKVTYRGNYKFNNKNSNTTKVKQLFLYIPKEKILQYLKSSRINQKNYYKLNDKNLTKLSRTIEKDPNFIKLSISDTSQEKFLKIKKVIPFTDDFDELHLEIHIDLKKIKKNKKPHYEIVYTEFFPNNNHVLMIHSFKEFVERFKFDLITPKDMNEETFYEAFLLNYKQINNIKAGSEIQNIFPGSVFVLKRKQNYQNSNPIRSRAK